MSKHWLILLGACSLQVLPVQAQEVRVGMEAVLASPSSGLKDNAGSSGYGGTLTLDLQISEQQVLRPRLDFIKYTDKTTSDTVLSGPTSTTVTSTSSTRSYGIGLDYLFYPQGVSGKWHLDAGMEAIHYDINLKGLVSFGAFTTSTTPFSGPNLSTTHLGLALGAGYDFGRNWLAGLRLTTTSLDGTRYNSMNASIGYRF